MGHLPSKNFKISEIVSNVWENTTYRLIIFALLVVSLIAPFYAINYAMPSFTRELIKITEDDASRTAQYLAHYFSSKQLLPLAVEKQSLTQLQLAFDIHKIRFFSPEGKVLYSTDPVEVGQINNKDYFRKIVAKGIPFTKVAKKGTRSMEGKQMVIDVAEVYIPLMDNNIFSGAFELYYNITKRKNRLDTLLQQSTTIAIISSFLFLSFSLSMLFIASRNDLRRSFLGKQLNALNNTLEHKVNKQTLEIKLNQEITIEMLAGLAEYHDDDTGRHLQRIQFYVNVIAEKLLNDSVYSAYLSSKKEYISEISLAAILHDIGKIAIAKSILTKPGRLTEEEFDIMKNHTVIAGGLLKQANEKFLGQFHKDSYLALARDIAQHHHEKWDGSGYPLGLAEEDIPLSARIVALVDVYDALRSRRPYKDQWTHEETVQEIIGQKGKHFDPVVVDAFMATADLIKSYSEYL